MAINVYKVPEGGKVSLNDTSGENPSLKTISSLSNRPSDDGYSAAELKAIFDAIPLTYLGLNKINLFIDLYNGLVEHIKTNSGDLNILPEGITATTIKTALEELAALIVALQNTTNSLLAEKGVPGGTATLEASRGKIPIWQMNEEAIVGGVIENAVKAKEFDAEYSGENSIKDALDMKQGLLAFDDEPTAASENPVKSNGIYEALQSRPRTYFQTTEPTSPRMEDRWVNNGIEKIFDGAAWTNIYAVYA